MRLFVHTFSILVNSADCDELANQMHQRWLSNKNFGRVAALIVLHYHKADDTNLTLFSKCLYHILTDYRNRFMIRNKNRLVFRNSVRALLELYTTFRQIDPIISESLLKPIFSSLKMLIDDQADNNDIESLCEIFIDKGSILVKLKPIKCEKIILRMRTCLCEWQQLTTNTRRLLLKNGKANGTI
ncbi:unnamed protein product [Dracunculus medinensis]|uniref:Ras-GAP domain-containing protein n=1 Tax=Dracunculus medinensis TaxID=318479 RepID=A0A0N4U1H2_DRAME|nr:unnamed protein product [Dracunculus medinensis]